MHRLFIALRPPPFVRALLAAAMSGVPHARWQDDDQLHLTLRFIGAVERPVAEDIAVAIGSIHAAAPRLAIAGVGRFDHRGRTETLWAGIKPDPALLALYRKVDQAMVRVGLPHEPRAYLPHITLARLPRAAGVEIEVARWLAEHATLSAPSFPASHVILHESTLGSGGARYETIARWPLEG